MYRLEGKVKSGLGDAAFWINKAKRIFQEKYNMDLYPGTLNIELKEDFILDDKEKLLPHEYGGEYDVLVQKCYILGDIAYILRPKKNNSLGGDHSLKIIEIVSDKYMRGEHNLKDGDTVTIEILNNA